MVIFLPLLGLLGLILLSVNVFLFLYFRKTNKKIDNILDKGKIKNFKDIFLAQKERNDQLEERVKEAFLKIKSLEKTCDVTIQKIGMVRFNPFNGVGGNQSFVVALLDGKDNGFLISSLFSEDGNRVYAKTIKQGKSDYALSKEEIDAIERAIDAK